MILGDGLQEIPLIFPAEVPHENPFDEWLMSHYGKVTEAQEEKFNELKKHGAFPALGGHPPQW